MKLPHAENLQISEQKLAEYLLSEKHPIGRTKARLFQQFGYSSERWRVLAEDLTEIALEQDVTREEKTLFWVRYVIDGVLRTPLGRELSIRTIWFIDNDGQIPHFCDSLSKVIS